MPRKKGSPKNPKAVAAGKKAWRSLSPAKKAAAKKRLAKFRFSKGGGTRPAASSHPASNPAPGGGTTGETKKRAKIEPVPVIGVRGSHAVSGAKVLVLGVGASAAIVGRDRGAGPSAFDALSDPAFEGTRKLTVAADRGTQRLREIWDDHSGKILLLGGGMLLFGKKIDKRLRDFPIKFGR